MRPELIFIISELQNSCIPSTFSVFFKALFRRLNQSLIFRPIQIDSGLRVRSLNSHKPRGIQIFRKLIVVGAPHRTVRWVNQEAQYEQSRILFGHLLKRVRTAGSENRI